MTTEFSENVAQEEELGRGISSSRNARRAQRSRVPVTEFLPAHGVTEISVDRLSVASISELTEIAEVRDISRGRNFYGWAVVNAAAASSSDRRVVVSPIPEINPDHADIILPPSAADDRAEQKRHAQELADLSFWRERATP